MEKHLREEENWLWEEGEKERERSRSRQKPLQGKIMRRRQVVRNRRRTKTGRVVGGGKMEIDLVGRHGLDGTSPSGGNIPSD